MTPKLTKLTKIERTQNSFNFRYTIYYNILNLYNLH